MAEPNPTNPCFGCGGPNPHGMQLAFDRDEEKRQIVGRFQLGPEFQGGPGFIHGGIIATILDEAMGKVCRFSEVRAVTAELSVQYLKPIRVGEEIRVEAFEESRKGKQMVHFGEIRNSAGDILAKGRGRFVIVDPERFRI